MKVYLLITLDQAGLSEYETLRGVYASKKDAQKEGERLKNSSYTKVLAIKVKTLTVIVETKGE